MTTLASLAGMPTQAAQAFGKPQGTRVSYSPKDYGLRASDKNFLQDLPGKRSLLILADELQPPETSDAVTVTKIPLDKNFEKNPLAIAPKLFDVLDSMPRPGLLACTSGKRGTVVVAAWVAARKGGSADAAVEYLQQLNYSLPNGYEAWIRGVVSRNVT
eukprot:CAMPEP_0119408348 /NCGR_PEP_ID=MMETSP1335-20130426/1925_1 /TAXON_ID=259385 /ORGANISM="Chrysoculter rhomboideus, Strain RCC1486" /LENGTH=158 /DNA_ID=CAMNT_0007432571 /DNA_START=124 /DNA_END=600 /DNA_ORIENTATION=-